MRLPFPQSIPLRPLLAFLSLMLLIQLVQGTDPAFAALMLIAPAAAAILQPRYQTLFLLRGEP
jgi:hypothetical protein